ncbi:cadherin-like domain-containing protein, partial [Malikia sp.]|uniref:cadherin-like domain-containing protein n=1 Tax=Malikia sp. TaxID=2070706 RepID=UPI002618133D
WNGTFPLVTYTVTDGSGTDDTSTLAITVDAVNDDFSDANETVSVLEDSSNHTGHLLTGTNSVDGPVTVKSFSLAGETGTFTLGTAYAVSGKGTLTVNADGSYSFTPAAHWNGAFPLVTYTVTDGSGTDDTSTLAITVDAVVDPVAVSSPTVNEASPYAVFTVTGVPGEAVTLQLASGSATMGGTDFGTVGATPLELSTDGGLSWTPYSTSATFPADGKLLARTPVQQDSAYEGSETFTLKATPVDAADATGATGATGTATIRDDGAGTVFKADGSEDASAAKDDDRLIKIPDVTVNEASPYAVFRIEASGGQRFTLSLQDGPDHVDPAIATATAGTDYGNSLETYDGVKWVAYVPGSLVSVPASGSVLLVRVPVFNDSEYEGTHAFTLVATIPGTAAVTSNGIIGDYGTGAIFNDSGAEDRFAPKDDDRGIKVDSPIVNEGSDFVVFTIQGPAGPIGLRMPASYETDEPIATGVDKSSANIQFWEDGVWKTYTGSNASIPEGGTLLVRVGLGGEHDEAREGPEHFALIATRDAVDSIGEASVRDDGTGVIYQFGADGGFSGTTVVGLDDDFDKDGIAPTTEEALATLAASQGIGDAVMGDINGDGTQDAEQSALATLAWTAKDYFVQGNAGTLTESKAIVSVSVTDGASSNAVSTSSQLLDIVVATYDEVDSNTELVLESDGSRTVTLADGSQASTPWDPIRFAVEGMDSNQDGQPDELSDIDLVRSGTQVRLLIDIRAAGLTTQEVNGYIKYVSREAIDSLGTLVDLDGNAITQAGWYDFTQRQSGGDGARFIDENGDGKIDYIELIITDNAFGDNDATLGKIFDPGTPVLIAQREPVPQQVEPVQLEAAHVEPAPVELDHAAHLPPMASIESVEGPIFQHSNFSSTLYALTSAADPKSLGLIERTNWDWADQDRDWANDRQPAPAAAAPRWTTLVLPSEVASLQVFRGMSDQFADSGAQGSFTVPADAFVHTQSGHEVVLAAKLADGAELPYWIRFDARSGQFSFEPPENFSGELRITLMARDAQGREATTLFRFHVGDKRVTVAGRAGLSQQLREAAQHKRGQRAAPVH